MSLTLGTGPLAGSPAAPSTSTSPSAPKHRIYFPTTRGGCARSSATAWCSTRRARSSCTRRGSCRCRTSRSTTSTPRCSSAPTTRPTARSRATRPTGRVRAGDRVLENAVWAYEDPLPEAAWLRGLRRALLEAGRRVVRRGGARLRPPARPVPPRRRARELAPGDGDAPAARVVARSDRPKLLFETGLPPRVYVPRADVAAGALAPAEKRTACPYKGEARYWSVAGDRGRGVELRDAAAGGDQGPGPRLLRRARRVEVELGEPSARSCRTPRRQLPRCVKRSGSNGAGSTTRRLAE